jgi:uncharacterized protein involved in response to NO
MVLLATILITVIGGRVVPKFTANGLQTKKVLPNRYLKIGATTSLVVTFIISIYTYWFNIIKYSLLNKHP